ncbi:Tetratricopeptide repeat protein 1 [Eufriesea mexicana]|uniref:Tetratricopeptide repeat protein 1 n=1 Tax=Eufriesea mexicana TaxID=516756 RepID=A0A310SKA6_9HYME|nr:PREDICTED: tetratricopeptide repeat protein 1 [Eufriesea mexicana]OAD60236.1 Tetratricopeptide repeat protein 1 [Eufriesea mexicana]
MDDKFQGLKTNEQIIEELTKDLESSCIAVNDNHSASKDDIATNIPTKSASIKDSYHSDNRHTSTKHVEHTEESSADNKCGKDDEHDTSRPKDRMDEDSCLKDRELTLSEDEKKILKAEAEEYKDKGNDFFKCEEYHQAISMYTHGIQTCPLAYSKERSILYANRAAAKLKCLDKESAISDCTKAIELNPSYVKVYGRRARLYEETEKLDEALEDYKKILTFDPSHVEANYAIRRLPPLIHERNEKLKTEMLGKLKDLGNMFLKPLGLSTNNFELQQDPNSGSYSVKFHQNPRN